MQTPKICIVDDHEAVCDSLKFLFTSCYDLNVIIYHNPLLFLDDFSSTWTGCLIIDLFMPFMNGIDVLKALTKRNNTMGVILTSGHCTSDTITQSSETGSFTFMNKPLNTAYLLKTVAENFKTDILVK